MQPAIVEGNLLNGRARKFALVVGRFNQFVVQSLEAGAIDILVRHGVEVADITVYRAPGAVEIPLLVQSVIRHRKPDAVVALGAVIRGGTPHFEYVAGGCASSLNQIMLQSGTPISFGVLTVDTIEQAIERSGTKAGNKGEEAALAALEMIDVLDRVQS